MNRFSVHLTAADHESISTRARAVINSGMSPKALTWGFRFACSRWLLYTPKGRPAHETLFRHCWWQPAHLGGWRVLPCVPTLLTTSTAWERGADARMGDEDVAEALLCYPPRPPAPHKRSATSVTASSTGVRSRTTRTSTSRRSRWLEGTANVCRHGTTGERPVDRVSIQLNERSDRPTSAAAPRCIREPVDAVHWKYARRICDRASPLSSPLCPPAASRFDRLRQRSPPPRKVRSPPSGPHSTPAPSPCRARTASSTVRGQAADFGSTQPAASGA